MVNYIPKISICIPTYNRWHTIKETIESVLNQTFKDFELLVCIDWSTDNTFEILSLFDDSRLHIYNNDKNIWYIKTMHKLTELSSTNRIQFLSDDDVLDNMFLEFSYKIIEKKPDIGFVVTWNNFIDKKWDYIYKVNRKYIKKEDYYENMEDYILFPPKEMLGNFTMMSIPMLWWKYNEILPTAFPNHIFNKSILIDIWESDEELFYNHDTLQVAKFSVIASCVYIDKPLVNYRIHDNLSKKAWISVEFIRQYFMFIFKFCFFLESRNIVIDNIKYKLIKAFELWLFAWNGHLIRIASKANNFLSKIKNLNANLKIVFDNIPNAKYNIKNLFIILIAYSFPSKLIEKIGMFYFKYIKK